MKKYEKPTIEKVNGFDFIRQLNSENFTCKHCSACHCCK